MRSIINISISVLILSSLVSCKSTKSIQKTMNANSYSMAYLMDSKVSDFKSDKALQIDNIHFNPNLINDTTKVIREKGWFIPLVFVYIWDSQNKCIKGKSMIQEEIPNFLEESLTAEVERSGTFNIDSLDDSEYQIELSIDEIKTEGPYKSSGFFYFALYVYGYSYSDQAGPAISNLTISYKLKKKNKIIHSNSFSSERMTEPIIKRYNNTKLLQQDYAISMVEATSFNFKDVIKKIVFDINTFFENN